MYLRLPSFCAYKHIILIHFPKLIIFFYSICHMDRFNECAVWIYQKLLAEPLPVLINYL